MALAYLLLMAALLIAFFKLDRLAYAVLFADFLLVTWMFVQHII